MKSTLIIIVALLVTCLYCDYKQCGHQFEIINKMEVSEYFIFDAVRLQSRDTVILLTRKKSDCDGEHGLVIIEGEKYCLNTKQLHYLEVRGGNFSLVERDFELEGKTISGNGRLPFAIDNSCNDFVYEE